MLIENITYLITFVATTGMAVIGSLLAYQLFHENKMPALQILLYQQILLFSFFIYAIWGNIILRQIVADVNLNAELSAKIAFFLPVLGIPFLTGSWFMLLKFAFNLNGYRDSKLWIYGYFSGFLFLMLVFAFLFQNNFLKTPDNPDVLLVHLFLALNLLFHLVFIFPFVKQNKKKPTAFDRRKFHQCIISYFTGVVLYSILLWFLGNFGFIGVNLSFIVVFGVSSLLPVCIKLFVVFPSKKVTESKKDFETFCADYEISKREAEIILEICSGKTNKTIAEELFITLQTVKDHTHHIYTKTQVKNRIQLANLVREKTGMN
jgi:DNA-binding CsgD family transcriptional regulator